MAADLSPVLNGRSTVGDDDRSLDVPADPVTRTALMKDCREYLVTRMCELVAGALEKIADELTDSALRSHHRQEQQTMLEAVALVRSQHADLAASFRDAFVDCFERRARGDLVAAPMPHEGELSLIDDSELSGKLNVDRLVHRARSRLDPDEVLGMRARLAALLERDWFDESEHPAAPEAVYEALKQAVAGLAADSGVQAALLDAFEPHVTASLNRVYSQTNERLRIHRVLPKIRRPVFKAQPAEARVARAAGAGEAGADVDAASASGHAHPIARGAPGPTHPGSAGFIAAGATTGQGTSGAGLNPQTIIGGADGAALTPALQWQMSLDQLDRGVPTARESVARLLTDPDSFGVADLPLPLVQPPLLQSLSHLQADAGQLGVDPLLPGAPLSLQVFDRAREQGSSLDQLTVEIVSMVFDYLYADQRLSDIVKQQLLRLQVVAVKAALIDRSFFARRAHPMRQLIDRITEMATDPDLDFGADSALFAGLTELIGWILASFDQDLATFDEALRRLAELGEREQQRRAAQLADVTRDAERAELRAQECAKAQRLLQQRCDDATPAFLKQFLQQWWSQVMAELVVCETAAPAEATVDGGSAAMRAAEALQLGEALIWSVAPKLADEVSRLAMMLPKILQGLNRGLAVIEIPAEPRQAFLNELLRVHTGAIATAKSAQAQRVAVFNATAKVRLRSDGELHFQPTRIMESAATRQAESIEPAASQQARIRLADQVQRGDRLEIDEDGQTHRFKLAWISPSQRLYVLSRHPQDARSFDALAFARLFESGRARVIERRSSVDAALQRAVIGAVPSSPPASTAMN